MAFLTMRSDRQPVATHGNGFRLFLRFLRRPDLRLVATGCTTGLLARADNTAGTGPLRRRSWQTRRRSPSRTAGCPSSMSRARPVAILATWGPLSYVSFYARRGSGARDAKKRSTVSSGSMLR